MIIGPDENRGLSAPWSHTDGYRIFLAGGITNCEDWQGRAEVELDCHLRRIYNPRLSEAIDFSGDGALEQIRWEFGKLKIVDAIFFWFDGGESLQPISLFEYGSHLVGDKTLFVGAAPTYKRRYDLEVQTSLVRPQQHIHETLDGVIQEAKNFLYFNGK